MTFRNKNDYSRECNNGKTKLGKIFQNFRGTKNEESQCFSANDMVCPYETKPNRYIYQTEYFRHACLRIKTNTANYF